MRIAVIFSIRGNILIKELASVIDLTCLDQMDQVALKFIERLQMAKHGIFIAQLVI